MVDSSSSRHSYASTAPTPFEVPIAIAGLAAPLLFGAIFMVAQSLRPGYNPVRQYGSELEVGQYGWLQRGNFLLVGLLLIALAYSLHRGIARGPGWWLGPGLVAVSGVALAMEATFPSGTMHLRSAKVFMPRRGTPAHEIGADVILSTVYAEGDGLWRKVATRLVPRARAKV